VYPAITLDGESERVQFLLGLLERDPDLYLDEIASELHYQHGVNASIPTVWRTLTALGLSRKKVWVPVPHFDFFSNTANSCQNLQESGVMNNDNFMQHWLVWKTLDVLSSSMKPPLTFG